MSEPYSKTSKERVADLLAYWTSCDPGEEIFLREDILRDTVALLRGECIPVPQVGNAALSQSARRDSSERRQPITAHEPATGRFEVTFNPSTGARGILDDGPEDALLRVDGNFESDEAKRLYCERIAEMLNRAAQPPSAAPKDWPTLAAEEYEKHHLNLPSTTATLNRTIDRHVRWREKALEHLSRVLAEGGGAEEWPEIAEFIQQSNSRLVAAETKFSGTPGFPPETPEQERSVRRDRYPPRSTEGG